MMTKCLFRLIGGNCIRQPGGQSLALGDHKIATTCYGFMDSVGLCYIIMFCASIEAMVSYTVHIMKYCNKAFNYNAVWFVFNI